MNEIRFWKKWPLFRLLAPFLLGILSGIYIPNSQSVVLGIMLIAWLLLAAYAFYTKLRQSYILRWWFGLAIHLLFFGLGYFHCQLRTSEPPTYLFREVHYFIGEITQKKNEKSGLIHLKSIKNNSKWSKIDENVSFYVKNGKEINLGDILLLRGQLQPTKKPQNPHEFNYQNYLAWQQVHAQLFLDSSSCKIIGHKESLISLSDKLRLRLEQIFEEQKLSKKQVAILKALVLGNRTEIDPSTQQAFSASGAMHVLAVSGLHVGIIYLILLQVLSFLKNNRWGFGLQLWSCLLFLWFYAFVTGLSPSVLRAVFMFSFIIIGKMLNRQSNSINTVLASAFFLLIIDPYYIMQVGFQLSYAAVLGILIIYPLIYHWKEERLWLWDKIWSITCVSIAAQLATFPLSLHYFHQFPNYFLLSNLVVIPLSTLLLYWALFSLFVYPVTILFKMACFSNDLLSKFLLDFVSWVEQLPYALLDMIALSEGEGWMLLLCLLFLIRFAQTAQKIPLQLALAFFLLLFSYRLYLGWVQSKQKQIIVYSVNGHSAIDFINGHRNILLADTLFLQNENKQRFHIKNNWIQSGIKTPRIIGLDSLTAFKNEIITYKQGFVVFEHKVILRLNKTMGLYTVRPAIDYLILSKGCKNSLKQLIQQFDIKHIILDTSVPYYQLNKWKEEAPKVNLKLYSIRENGAFVVEV